MTQNGLKCGVLDISLRRRSHSIFRDILRECSQKKFPRILDVGCNFGVIGALRGDPRNVIGIERDPGLLPFAEKNCEKVYAIDLNVFRKEMIEGEPFDFIFFGDVLEHVLEPESLLKESIRLLRDDGRVILSVPNIAQLPFRLKLLLGRFDYTEAGVLARSHLHLYTYKTARELIVASGLVPERFFPSGTIVSYVNIFPTLLAAQLIFLCRKKR